MNYPKYTDAELTQREANRRQVDAALADRGPWIQTYSGRPFYLLDPRPDDVSALDVAHALGMTCRYGGHTTKFYSVAEHCHWMSTWVPQEHALMALLHDAAEAYVGDVVTPLKELLVGYVPIENSILGAIGERFGVSRLHDLPIEVREADRRIMADEREYLMLPSEVGWENDPGVPLGIDPQGWSPEVASTIWLNRLETLLPNDVPLYP